MDDLDIIELYWQRSDRAIAETSRKYGRYCHSIAHNICGSEQDAEECVNDTWFRAWNLIPPERPAVLPVFLGGITRNIAINCIRYKSRKKRRSGETDLALEELQECIPGGTSPASALEEKELKEAIGGFVSKLPEPEKAVFVLRYWYLASIAEISEKMKFSQGKVKTMLFRSRRKLASFLKEEGLC
ncbi:MAG: RNA polymerase sigma factor [Oscillospiraceae bacterium]|nr:RNA polymerase sigma factor [Oscillospiraceae bacterium]